MSKATSSFEIEKTFGIDVLLKLTKINNNDILFSESGGKYTFNISMDELKQAVCTTLVNHNISLMVE